MDLIPYSRPLIQSSLLVVAVLWTYIWIGYSILWCSLYASLMPATIALECRNDAQECTLKACIMRGSLLCDKSRGQTVWMLRPRIATNRISKEPKADDVTLHREGNTESFQEDIEKLQSVILWLRSKDSLPFCLGCLEAVRKRQLMAEAGSDRLESGGLNEIETARCWRG